MKKLVCIALFFTSFLNAQVVFEKGYFISENNEKTSCFIKNNEWLNNPTKFSYKANENDEDVKTETIASVKEFGVDGGVHYKRFKINIERSSFELDKLDNNRNPVFNEEVLFLKFLVEGEANLYNYRNNGVTKFFYDTPTVPTEQLISIVYLASDNQSTKKNNLYQQQLLNNVSCGNMTEQNTFGRIDYYENDLSKHFKKYNICKTGVAASDSPTKNTDLFALKVTASIGQATAEITNPKTVYNYNTDFTEILYKVGFEAEYFLPFNKKSWSVFINPSYNFFKSQYQYTTDDAAPQFPGNGPFELHLDYASVEIPIGLRYHFHLNTNAQIFVNLAGGYEFVMDSKLNLSDSAVQSNFDPELDVSSGTFFAFGAGYSYKKFGAEIRLSGRDLLEDYTDWNGKFRTSSLVLSYNFL